MAITLNIHAVENAKVKIPASLTPLILVTIINHTNELNALNEVPIVFQIKLMKYYGKKTTNITQMSS